MGAKKGVARLPKGPPVDLGPKALTEQNMAVLRHAADGLGCKETAERLNISDFAVRHHRQQIREKLGAGSTAQAVLIALQRGILK
jgi:DNA-binding NarL/FixJ family response regulator